MENPILNFKKQREIGEVISDTFRFLRENYKLLFTLILKYTWPALLVLMLSLGYYLYLTFDNLSIFSASNPELFSENMFVGGMLIAIFFILISLVGYFSLLYGTVLNFIKSYMKNNGTVNELEVQQGVKTDFWNVLGGGILTSIMVFFGLLVCFFPGIYLMVPLSLVFAILIFEKRDISGAISHSFTLIKDNWWVSFATMFVIWLLIYLIGMIFSLPALFYSFIKAFIISEEVSMANPAEIFDWVYVTLNLISSLVQYLLYSITVISTAFIYFNLNERKNFTGTFETIENLGKKE